ncbi:solute carrier family 25 member 16-like [Babylonia areolata]|uniref:solute carrier family 25 member 16-like n=1 Tax=Babylonia areolata TaxID=304850 RepID=UPI003FD525AD
MTASNKMNEIYDALSSESVKTFVAGGVAGCCAKSAVAPLDRVKILMQAHNTHYKDLGVYGTFKEVLTKEGALGLFKGNGVQMIRIFPYAAIQFTAFEQYKDWLKPRIPNHPHLDRLLAGSLAGLTAVLITYPLDVVRSRVAFQVKAGPLEMGMRGMVRTMRLTEGGMRPFYRGIVPSIIGMAPYSGISFYSFTMIKTWCLDNYPDILGKPCPQNTGGLVLVVPAKLVCGGLAGAMAQTVSYPLDVVRRQLQLGKMHSEMKRFEGRSWYEIMVLVYHDHGMTKGLFRGMSINYLRIMPMVGISFTVYEMTKQFLGLDTGFDR